MTCCPLYTQNIVCDRCSQDEYGFDIAWVVGCPFYPSHQTFRQRVYEKYNEIITTQVSEQVEQFSEFGDAAYRTGTTFQQWAEKWRGLIEFDKYWNMAAQTVTNTSYEVSYASTDEEDNVVEEKPRPNYRFKPMAYRQPQRQRPMRVARSNCGRRR